MKFSKNLLPTLACGSLAFGTVQAQDGETSPTAEVAAEEAPQESMKIEVPSDVKAPPADAEKTASGLASKVLQKGTGTEKPSSTDTVTVHYLVGRLMERCSTALWSVVARPLSLLME